MSRDLPETSDYGGLAIAVNAIVAVAVAVALLWAAEQFSVWHEALFRIGPAYQGSVRGVGTDWVVGNSLPALHFAIALIHAADVIMGLFILLMVFIHWISFRRLAAKMRRPNEDAPRGVATDGGADAERGDRRRRAKRGGDRR